jgi:metal-sulfur cluster biosynthetic enzyme
MTDVSQAVVEALRTVYDPCCEDKGISVVDMGLVRAVELDGADARVELILTTGWCPFAANLVTMISERVAALPEVGGASVEIVWDEAWTSERLSADARRKLRFLPDPSAVPDRDAYLAGRAGPAPTPASSPSTSRQPEPEGDGDDRS